MAAGLGFKTFTTGEVLTAADTNGYLMQGILVFASAAARDAAITSPQEGQFAYLKDTNVTTYYTGSAWANVDTTGMTNPMTTTGDTIYSSSGSTPARLGIGSTGNVLTVAGGVPTWAAPAGGGGMTLITETVASANTGIAFTSISGSYKQLLLTWCGMYHSTTGSEFYLKFNNSSSAVYATGEVDQNGVDQIIQSTRGAGYNTFGQNNSSTSIEKTMYGSCLIDNYASSTKAKFYELNYSMYDNTYAAIFEFRNVAWFNDTTAITSLDIVRATGSATLSNAANTSIRLYGIS